ncbi:MAG: molybdopterin-binding protein [Chloroflexi bacterium]|nr:molybdopterin-binding protein [Chloroflexota bacterium]
MPEFFNVLPPQQALAALLEVLPSPAPACEDVPVHEALGRVTATDLVSRQDLPTFPRSTVDGYSLRAADTFGATEGLPAYFSVVGVVPMGRAPGVSVNLGEAAGTYTGGMLAGGADAVVMVENTQQVDADTIEVVRPVAPGENVVQPGEDVREGESILPRGRLLRPQDIGGLAALGITSAPVARRPRIAVLSMGDEVVSPDREPAIGQIRDVNSYSIASQILRDGGEPVPLGIVSDNYETQLEAARRGLEHSDALVFSAGSSVSSRDMTADIINALGEPGVLVHGLSIRPGKPAILGMVADKPVFGLPGNPVSAMIVFDLLVRPVIYRLAGCLAIPEPARTAARLDRDLASASGREDYVPVRLRRNGDNGAEELVAEPVFGKSNLIFTLIRADGLVQVPLDKAGLYAGETVTVTLF